MLVPASHGGINTDAMNRIVSAADAFANKYEDDAFTVAIESGRSAGDIANAAESAISTFGNHSEGLWAFGALLDSERSGDEFASIANAADLFDNKYEGDALKIALASKRSDSDVVSAARYISRTLGSGHTGRDAFDSLLRSGRSESEFENVTNAADLFDNKYEDDALKIALASKRSDSDVATAARSITRTLGSGHTGLNAFDSLLRSTRAASEFENVTNAADLFDNKYEDDALKIALASKRSDSDVALAAKFVTSAMGSGSTGLESFESLLNSDRAASEFGRIIVAADSFDSKYEDVALRIILNSDATATEAREAVISATNSQGRGSKGIQLFESLLDG